MPESHCSERCKTSPCNVCKCSRPSHTLVFRLELIYFGNIKQQSPARGNTGPNHHFEPAYENDISPVQDFLAALNPPQPQLLKVLQEAGITDLDRLQFVARDSASAELFLRELVKASKLNAFEYTYLKMAMEVM